MRRSLWKPGLWALVAMGVLLRQPVAGGEPVATLEFDDLPEIVGRAGTTATFDVLATITAHVAEIRGWTLSLSADGAEIVEVADRDPRLIRTDFSFADVAEHTSDPARRGAVAFSGCVFYPFARALAPSQTYRILRLTLETAFPPAGESRPVVLHYEDGFLSPRGQAVVNSVIINGVSLEPSITSRTLCLRGSTWFRRGDANADGRVDLADAVFGLNFLFRGGPAPHCERSLDADDDGAINLGDSLHLLQYLLFRGPPPASPLPACGSEGSEALPCARHPPCV